MSHVATVDLQILDLNCLARACAQLGVEFRENQKTFNWWGKWVGDYHADDAAYKRFNPETFGKCVHAISIPGTITDRNRSEQPFEIGLVPRLDGKPGFEPLFDFYGSRGQAIMKLLGTPDGRGTVKNLNKLKQAYAEQVAQEQCRKQGFRVLRSVNPATGKVSLRAVR